MWSGPRNLSTAMMYAFGNRADCAIWDEPFYAPYLAQSGQIHPMQQEILTAHEVDPDIVAQRCLDTIPAEKPHFYMKQMPHHMIDGFPIAWAKSCVNIHLIRHPARVISSYGAKRDQINLDDIGYVQQAQLYDALGGLVVDSADIRDNPHVMLQGICDAIGLDFDPAMLSWKAGSRIEDGVWAKHWYGAVHQSTGFAGSEGPMPLLDEMQTRLLDEALSHYKKMHAARLSLTSLVY